MTQVGLASGVECLNTCSEGWNGFLKSSRSRLYQLPKWLD
jgi:hypothetical protein